MEYLQNLSDGSTIPMLTAFLLGVLTAISPCPLATNIVAVSYISKNPENRRRIFFDGLFYTLGRVTAYTLLGAVLISVLREGASIFAIQKFIGKWGEILIAPVLVLIGTFMLFGHRLNLPKFGISDRCAKIAHGGRWGAFMLGVIFSLTFCPTSGVFYFGMLIPMSAAETGGYLLPAVFAVGSGLPIVALAWILAYSIAGLAAFYNRMQVIQKWLATAAGMLFVAAGIYYGIIYLF